jgi:polyisoprenoid-binding protein YceI
MKTCSTRNRTILLFMLSLSIILSSFAYLEGIAWNIPSGTRTHFVIDGLLGFDVKGDLEITASHISFNPAEPRQGNMDVSLSVASVNTGNKKRDHHLNQDDFFDAARFPEIRFRSAAIEKINDTAYTVTGDLSIKDSTHTVTIPFTFDERDGQSLFRGKFTLNRMDYGVGSGHKRLIGKEVRVTLVIPVEKVKAD